MNKCHVGYRCDKMKLYKKKTAAVVRNSTVLFVTDVEKIKLYNHIIIDLLCVLKRVQCAQHIFQLGEKHTWRILLCVPMPALNPNISPCFDVFQLVTTVAPLRSPSSRSSHLRLSLWFFFPSPYAPSCAVTSRPYVTLAACIIAKQSTDVADSIKLHIKNKTKQNENQSNFLLIQTRQQMQQQHPQLCLFMQIL